jgi:hypothetical protein
MTLGNCCLLVVKSEAMLCSAHNERESQRGRCRNLCLEKEFSRSRVVFCIQTWPWDKRARFVARDSRLRALPPETVGRNVYHVLSSDNATPESM